MTMKKVSHSNCQPKPKSQKINKITKSVEKVFGDKEMDFRLLDGFPIGLYRSSVNGHFLNTNDTLVEMFAFPDRESFLETNATDLYLNSDDRKQWQTLMDRDGVVQHFEVQMKTGNGATIWIEDDARVVRDDKNSILYYEGSLRNITKRRQAEHKLRKSEEHFRNAMEYAAIGKALVAPDGRWLKVNHSLCKILGYSEDELLKTDFQSLTFPDDLNSDLEYVRQMLAGEIETYQMEKRYIHEQGHIVWALLSVSLVHDSIGEPLYFISQIHDITAQKQTELALQKNEQRYRTLADFTYNWEHWINPQGKCVYVSPAVERITDYKPEEFLQNSQFFFDIIQLEDKEKVKAHFKAHTQRGNPSSCEFRIIRRDGKVRWIEYLCQSVYDENGKWLGQRGSNIDITDRKLSEEALQLSEKRLKEAERAAQLGHWELDLKDNSLHWSDEVFRIFGLNPTNFKATYEAYLEAIHPDDREYVNKAYSDSLKNRTKYDIIHRLKLKDGTEKYVEETCKTIYDTQDAPLRSTGTVQDITDRIIVQKEIVRKTDVLEAINRVFQETLSCETEEDVAYACITVAQKITGSKIGLIGELNQKGLFDTITYGDLRWSICKMPESEAITLSKDMEIKGIWAQALITGKSQIVNDPASHPGRVGTPKGHPQLTSFLGVPLKYSKKTIGMIGLANKEGGYTNTDVESVETLSVAFVEALIRKRAEIRIKKSLQEKNALLSEIHHRVKNNMNVIVGLLNLQSRRIDDLPSIIALQNCVKRIHSMALVHEKLYQSKDFTNINMKDYIETLVHELDYSYGRSKEIFTSINVGEISVHIETAIPIGLIINELMTNATKHAFLEGRKGNIKILLTQLIKNTYELSVHDDGIGLPKDIDMETIETLGLKLVHLLTKQLNGKISINTEKGTTFKIQYKGTMQ
jgi:PAS domain S-box-containing protein